MRFRMTALARQVLADDWIEFHTDQILALLWKHARNSFNGEDWALSFTSIHNATGLDLDEIEEISSKQIDRGWVQVIGSVDAQAARLTPLGRDEVSFRTAVASLIQDA